MRDFRALRARFQPNRDYSCSFEQLNSSPYIFIFPTFFFCFNSNFSLIFANHYLWTHDAGLGTLALAKFENGALRG